jgi:hypothetical protein
VSDLDRKVVFGEIIGKVQEKMISWGFNAVDFAPNLVLAFIILIFGIFVGKFVKWTLGKVLINGFKLNSVFRFGFIETSLIAVKWIVYILFFQYALTVLQLPFLSDYLTKGLGIIPQVISSVVIVIIGYAIAVFLKKGLVRTEREPLELLGSILFIFVIYISLTLALISAFASIQDVATNTILIIAALAIAGFVWMYNEKFKKG